MHRLAAVGILGGLMALGVAACGASSVGSPPTSTTSTAPVPSTAPSTTTPGSTTTSLRVVVCPTTYGVGPPATTSPVPASMAVSIPEALAGELAVYADSAGIMKLLAPSGWSCVAEYGADGSGGVATYPPGESISSSAFGGGWTLSADSSTEAIVASQTGGCVGCAVGQACRLFPAAASSYQRQFGLVCQKSPPASETVDQITPGVVAFEDPPGVAGDGEPSGGRYPANGVMTYYSNSGFGSWLDTCTVPRAEKPLCTAALDTFLAWYGED